MCLIGQHPTLHIAAPPPLTNLIASHVQGLHGSRDRVCGSRGRGAAERCLSQHTNMSSGGSSAMQHSPTQVGANPVHQPQLPTITQRTPVVLM